METFLNLISKFPIQELAAIATVLFKEQYTVKMYVGCKKHDGNACITVIFQCCPHPRIYREKMVNLG